ESQAPSCHSGNGRIQWVALIRSRAWHLPSPFSGSPTTRRRSSKSTGYHECEESAKGGARGRRRPAGAAPERGYHMSNFPWDAQQNPVEKPGQMGMFARLGMVPSTNRPMTERPQAVPSRPLTERPMASYGPASRPNLNEEVKRTLAATRERRQQRRRVI